MGECSFFVDCLSFVKKNVATVDAQFNSDIGLIFKQTHIVCYTSSLVCRGSKRQLPETKFHRSWSYLSGQLLTMDVKYDIDIHNPTDPSLLPWIQSFYQSSSSICRAFFVNTFHYQESVSISESNLKHLITPECDAAVMTCSRQEILCFTNVHGSNQLRMPLHYQLPNASSDIPYTHTSIV